MVLPRAVTSTQPMPAKASCPTHPPFLLRGFCRPSGNICHGQSALVVSTSCFAWPANATYTKSSSCASATPPPQAPPTLFFFGRNRYHVLLSSARTTHTTSQQPHTPSPPRLRRNLPTAFPQLSLVQTPRCFRSARNSSTHCARASMELTYTLTPYTFAHMRLHMSPTVPNNYIETLICSLEKKPRHGPNPPKLHTPRPGYTCFKLSAPHNNCSKKTRCM